MHHACCVNKYSLVFEVPKASDEDKDMKPCNAIYYWKTQFQLNNYEKSFIEKHDIRKYISDSLMLTMGKIKTAYLRHFP